MDKKKCAEENASRVTSVDYWDTVWRDTSSFKMAGKEFYFGKNGLFSKFIRIHLGEIQNRLVIELGGGGENYRLLCMAKEMGAIVTAVDYSEQGLSLVRRIFDANQVEADFVNCDIDNYHREVGADVVVHWGVLEHFSDPKPILKKSFDLLVPGGELLFSMPNMEAWAARFWEKWCPENWSKHIFHESDFLEKMMRELGFSDVDTFYFGVPCMKFSEWERRSNLQLPVDMLQKCASGIARTIPVFHGIGGKLYSMERGFYARKPY